MWPLGAPVPLLLPIPQGLCSWGGLGVGKGRPCGQPQPRTCHQGPLPQCSSRPCRPAAPSQRPLAHHAELGFLKMRAGSPSSQGGPCGFQTMALTLQRPVAPLHALHLCGVGGWEGLALPGSLTFRACLWGQQLLKHPRQTDRQMGNRAAVLRCGRRDTGLPGSPPSGLLFLPTQAALLSGNFCGHRENPSLEEAPLKLNSQPPAPAGFVESRPHLCSQKAAEASLFGTFPLVSV